MASPRPKIVYVVTSSGIGGAESQVFDLAMTFHARGWEVTVVSMRPLGDAFLPLQDHGIRLVTLGMRRGVPDPRALIHLAQLFRQWEPDVVHAHMVHANLISRLARLLAPTPRHISTMHSLDEGPQWRYYAYRLTDRLTDLTTTVSHTAVAEAVRRHAVPPGRMRLVRNGIRTERFRRDSGARDDTRRMLALGDAFTWLSAGRLVDVKRHADLLTAFRGVKDVEPNARLLIAGGGPLQDELEEQIAATGLGSSTSLLGDRSDVPDLMQAADGFVLSSAWEGLPITLLEASASSMPIVSTDVGGCREIVDDPATGFLTPGGQPAQLAEAMLRVMRLTTDERSAMGQRGRDRVAARFELDAVADEWEGLYGLTGDDDANSAGRS